MNNDQLTQFYHRYKTVIWPVVVGLCSLIIIGLVIFPQITSYLHLRQEGNDLNTRISNLQVKTKELEQIDPQVYGKNLELALSALPSDRQVPQAVSILQTFINRSGMTLETIGFLGSAETINTADSKSNNSYQLGVVVLGDYPGLQKLLDALRKSPRVFKIERINAQSGTKSNTVEANLDLTVFYEPVATTIGPINQPVPQLSDKNQQLLNDLVTKNQLIATNSSSLSVPVGKVDPFN